jgi:hypothetical protein
MLDDSLRAISLKSTDLVSGNHGNKHNRQLSIVALQSKTSHLGNSVVCMLLSNGKTEGFSIDSSGSRKMVRKKFASLETTAALKRE